MRPQAEVRRERQGQTGTTILMHRRYSRRRTAWPRALALGVVITLQFVAPVLADGVDALNPSITRTERDFKVLAGADSEQSGVPGITLDKAGVALLAVDTRGAALGGDRYLSYEVQFDTGITQIEVIWQAADSKQYRYLALPYRGPGLYRQDLAGVADWPRQSPTLVLKITGVPFGRIGLSRLAIQPVGGWQEARFRARQWLRERGWSQGSINLAYNYTYDTGWPPLVPALGGLALLAGLGGAAVWRDRGRALRWGVGVFLLAWLAADSAWLVLQGSRAMHTAERFGGLGPKQALKVSDDAWLVDLAAGIRAQVGDRGERIFVASSGDYRGMRTAYYLYPHNVHWQRHGPELPDAGLLRPGDLIVAVRPTALAFDPEEATLSAPGYPAVRVALLLESPAGALYRVLP